MSRKSLFTHLGDAKPPESPPAPSDAADARPARLRMRPILGSPDLVEARAAKPVGVIGESLGAFSERAKRAEEIEKKLTSGHAVVELDTTLIDPSFIADRMPAPPEAVASLAEAIRAHGQLNPILVRPHPEAPGRYQVAFGHRRLRAASSLGAPVKAVVRALSDVELVIAQGQENHERKDLSYIEKARFAQRLEKRFDRATIMAALSIYKSDLSNMLSVAAHIPEDVVDAIGPAPGVGRRGWIELAERFKESGAAASVRKAVADPGFAALASEDRFKAALAAASRKPKDDGAETWEIAGTAGPLAKISRSQNRLSVTVDRRKSPAFAEFLLDRLPRLYLEFEAARSAAADDAREKPKSGEQ